MTAPVVSIVAPACANFTEAKITVSISKGGINCSLSGGSLKFSGGSGLNAAALYSVSAGAITNITL